MSRITLEKSPFRLDRPGCPPYDGVREGAVPVKKRWKILLVCVVVVAAVAAIAAGICTRYVLHYPAVGEDYQIHIVEVGEGLADVTDQVDLEALGSLLQNAKRLGYHRGGNTVRMGKRHVLILGMDKTGPVNISLDEDACSVDRGDALGHYPLVNGEELLDQVWALLPEP